MPLCFLKSIAKSLLVITAITDNKITARIRRNIISVTGVNSAMAILVAINDIPQDTTANNGFQYIRNLFFSMRP